MLDLTWKVPVGLRDQIVSVLQGTDESTTEATNELVKRFLALKSGQTGGARFTGDSDRLEGLMMKLRDAVLSNSLKGTEEDVKSFEDDLKSEKLDFGSGLPFTAGISGEETRCFFIYGIEPRIAEWEIVEAVSKLVNTTEWQDSSTVAVVIRQDARCGGIRFKSNSLAATFVSALEKITVKSHTAELAHEKGVLQVRHMKMNVVNWPHFHVSALGSNSREYQAIAKLVQRAIYEDVAGSKSFSSEERGVDRRAEGGITKRNRENIKKPKKNKVRSHKRVAFLEL